MVEKLIERTLSMTRVSNKASKAYIISLNTQKVYNTALEIIRNVVTSLVSKQS